MNYVLKIKQPTILGFLGFFGFMAFFGFPIAGVAFTFFGFFFIGRLTKEKTDERLINNFKRGMQITARLGTLSCFFVLFALHLGASSGTVLLWGSVGLGVISALGDALAYFFDKRG
ncbi:MAG: DUF3796 domain-containing protein [Defluviitaleaceae bacterium]|nr:DUF3796 domain-containing protein [Defluviitaleaceae bacterium]